MSITLLLWTVCPCSILKAHSWCVKIILVSVYKCHITLPCSLFVCIFYSDSLLVVLRDREIERQREIKINREKKKEGESEIERKEIDVSLCNIYNKNKEKWWQSLTRRTFPTIVHS